MCGRQFRPPSEDVKLPAWLQLETSGLQAIELDSCGILAARVPSGVYRRFGSRWNRWSPRVRWGPRVEADWRRRGSLVLGCVTLRCGFRCLFALADKRPVERAGAVDFRATSSVTYCLCIGYKLIVRESAARGGVYKMGTQGARSARSGRRRGGWGEWERAWLERDRQ